MPVVGVYETMPTPGYDYQSWMLAEVKAIQKAVADRRLDGAPVTRRSRPTHRHGPSKTDVLRVEGVSVSLAGRQILDDVTFAGRGRGVHRADRLERGGQDHAAAGDPRPAATDAPGGCS